MSCFDDVFNLLLLEPLRINCALLDTLENSAPTVAVDDAAHLWNQLGDRKEEWVGSYYNSPKFHHCYMCFSDKSKLMLPKTSVYPIFWALQLQLSDSDDASLNLLSTTRSLGTDTDDAEDESDDDDGMPELLSSSDDEDIPATAFWALQQLSHSDGSLNLLSTTRLLGTDTDDAADESDDDDGMPELLSSSDDEDMLFLASATACSAA